jgi:hypothetical protein
VTIFISIYLLIGALCALLIDRLTDYRRGWDWSRVGLLVIVTLGWMPGALALGIAMAMNR